MADHPTPYAVICRLHGQRFLTQEFYTQQMSQPNERWRCPVCGEESEWDDINYENFMVSQE